MESTYGPGVGALAMAGVVAGLVLLARGLTGHRSAWSPPVGLHEQRGRRQYRELRLEPGDPVTILGRALPFVDLTDPDAGLKSA